MHFIVIFVSLLIERFFDWSHVRDWSWFWPYLRYTQRRFPQSAYLAIAVTIVPILIAVLLVSYFLSGWMYGFLSLLFNIFVLIYCLGPQNLWADTFSSITTLKEGDVQFGVEKLGLAFNAIAPSDVQAQHHTLLNAIFIAADRRVFAVVFWYLILGPAGVLLYRMTAVPYDGGKKAGEIQAEGLVKSLEQLEALMNWLPSRIFSFLFALGGHFMQVISVWKRLVWQGIHGNDELVAECGRAALGKTEQDIFPLDGSLERQAVSLLDRVFLITLVIIAPIAWFI